MSQYHALPHAVALNARLSFADVATPRRANLLARLKTAMIITRTRRALLTMDATDLADIGLSKEAARREARRSFFDNAPQCIR